jgi:hypothetical protein
MMRALLSFLAVADTCVVNAFVPSKMTHSSKVHHGIRLALLSSDADLSSGEHSDNAAELSLMAKQAANDDFHASRQREIEEWRRLPLSRRIPSNSPRLLPEVHEEDRGKKCLVLDLDETLIYQHCSKDRADVDIYFEILDPSLVRKMKCSATTGRY